MVQRCWVHFQCWGVLLIWIIVGQGPIALAVGAGGIVWAFFSHLSVKHNKHKTTNHIMNSNLK